MKCSRGRVSVAFVGLLVAVIAAAPKAVPDEVTRLAMFKRGEADIVYVFRGPPPRRAADARSLAETGPVLRGAMAALHRPVGSSSCTSG